MSLEHRPGIAGTAACAGLVMAVATMLMFAGLGRIRAPIWDESYYLTAVARTEAGQAQFASHPPLGLMLIAAGDWLTGGNETIDQRHMAAVKSIAAEAMPADYRYSGPRHAAALAGVIAAGLFFLLVVALTSSLWTGLLASTLTLFDTALIAQFRAGHLDPFQLMFVLAALLCLVRACGTRSRGAEIGLGVAIMAATLVRANALILLLPALVPIGLALRSDGRAEAVAAASRIAGGAVVAFLVVAMLWLATCRQPPIAGTAAGDADRRAMTETARQWADHERDMSGRVMLALLESYRRYIVADLAGTPREDANGSVPAEWLIGQRPITYRWDAEGAKVAYLALTPNLIAWLASLAGVVEGIGLLATRRATTRDAPLIAALLLLWGGTMLLHLWLAETRVMYLYHHMIALVAGQALAVMALAYLSGRWRERLTIIVAALALGHFFLAAPLAFHRPLSAGECAWRDAVGMIAECVTPR
ncbi:phospholipid carrier-dependent glycosyltransferase [Sphingomonas naphthae]|uniref:Polyprenol-phosphate-mannose--protein mannosyltransferase n=1 Tax=Sphingomonas naphthae TaxID=1813468 RepID=A0ABY7THK0_9SPHN|nr:phospholipid carrier-dependent glycosyltransferase [Sphingomonas naphthae]WCT72706.1 phospholipid carrier-dependent glycosyltransferase [Sphingomonas naphthae]